MLKDLFVDRVHRLPRKWSNSELEKVAHFYSGSVINVSAFKDEDKQGKYYREYFVNASFYSVTNFDADKNGMQGIDNEIFLDLEKPLPRTLVGKYDVVYNHTTLEHVFDVQTAFTNLCELSADSVVLVVPFLQQYHAHYGDFWRFSPELIVRLFEEHGYTSLYQSFNSHPRSSVYVFTVASKHPDRWKNKSIFKTWEFSSKVEHSRRDEPYVGSLALSNYAYRSYRGVINLIKRLLLRNP